MKSNRLSLVVQAGFLKYMFPGSKISRNREDSLIWTHTITPTPLSLNYTIKLHYKRFDGVKVYIIDPKPLPLAKGKTSLPHVYSTTEQRLCLYFPTTREWNVSMLYTKTIIPWACEWLMFYETWVATGTWLGGGIHHETEAEKQLNKLKESADE